MRAIGAMGAAAAMDALMQDRMIRAERVWTMAERALHARAMTARPAAFIPR